MEVILSDLINLYHPPTTKPPLQVDENKKGVDSDHYIVIFAPKSNLVFKVPRVKRQVKTRPLPDSKIPLFGQEIQNQTWEEVFNEEDLDKKV